MPSLSEITDLLFRRVRDYLRDDLVKEIYATFEGNRVKLTFILGSRIDTATLASIGARYNHHFADVHDTYTVQVLDATNHFTPGDSTYILWEFGKGFILP